MEFLTELLSKLRDHAEMTLEELEGLQETLEEKDYELYTKITMVKDEEKKAALQAERTKVQEAMVLVDAKIEEVKKRESGLSAYREEDEKESGLSAYREEDEKESGLSAYREEDANEESGKSADREETAKQEEEPDEEFRYHKDLAQEYWQAMKKSDDSYCEYDERRAAYETAKKIFAKVSMEAEKGNKDALVSLADIMFYNGSSLAPSLRLIKKAMAQGVPDAYFRMAYLSYTGVGVKKDDEKALVYLEKADELGSLPAILCKAETYAEGGCGDYKLVPHGWDDLRSFGTSLSYILNLPRDMHKATEYYKRYLENKWGDAKPDEYEYYRCLCNYVKCGIESGEEAFKDADNIRKLLLPLLERKTSRYLVPADMDAARTMYGNALCKEKRFREAVSLWLEDERPNGIENILKQYDAIVAAGDGAALDSLLEAKMNDTAQDGDKQKIREKILIWRGDRCGKDEAAAFTYYCKAAGAGSYNGKTKRDKLLKKYQEGSFIDAIVFFEESGEGGNADAYKYLGDLYTEDRRGNPHDYKKAFEYYRKCQAGTMREECEKQAEKMREWLGFEKRFAMAIDCVNSAVSGRKEEGLSMIRQLAEKKFPAAVEYLRKH